MSAMQTQTDWLPAVVSADGVQSGRAVPRAVVEAAALDPAVFCSRFCWIESDRGGPPRRFQLWPFQVEALRAFDKYDRVLVLKARQLGLSWLADVYALWLCTFNTGQTVLIFSYTQREAEEEIRRIKVMHDRLPPQLRRDRTKPDSKNNVEFPGMKSRIMSLPSTSDAGTGFTTQLVIVQEISKILNIETLMTAVAPTIGPGGKLLGISTARGFGNTFHRMWQACEGKLSPDHVEGPNDSPYVPLFFPRDAHPERDAAWHDAKRRELGNDRAFRQEYPSTPAEAFQLAGDSPFADYFSRSTHHIGYIRSPTMEGVHPEQRDPVWRGIDFGINTAVCYWMEVRPGGVVVVFSELVLEQRPTPTFAAEILRRDGELGLTTMLVRSGVDPAGGARDPQTTIPDVRILEDVGIPVAVDRRGKFARVGPSDRVGQMQYLLENRRLLVNCSECPRLAQAFEQAQWDSYAVGGVVKDTYKKDGINDHSLDSLGYALINIFPPTGGVGAVAVAPVVLPWA
jgi:hypothetical protein